jgi:hypothetical protein
VINCIEARPIGFAVGAGPIDMTVWPGDQVTLLTPARIDAQLDGAGVSSWACSARLGVSTST